MKLDFSNVPSSELIPEGTVELTCTGAKEKRSQNGTAMLVVDWNDPDGGFTRDNICLEGPGAFRAQQFIKALGMDESSFGGMEATDLIGVTVSAEVFHEEYEGEPRAKIKKYNAA